MHRRFTPMFNLSQALKDISKDFNLMAINLQRISLTHMKFIIHFSVRGVFYDRYHEILVKLNLPIFPELVKRRGNSQKLMLRIPKGGPFSGSSSIHELQFSERQKSKASQKLNSASVLFNYEIMKKPDTCKMISMEPSA